MTCSQGSEPCCGIDDSELVSRLGLLSVFLEKFLGEHTPVLLAFSPIYKDPNLLERGSRNFPPSLPNL